MRTVVDGDGREIRLPFLDSRLIDLMLRTRTNTAAQWLDQVCLREAMQPFLPPEIAWRKDKKGFPTRRRVLKRDSKLPVKEPSAPTA